MTRRKNAVCRALLALPLFTLGGCVSSSNYYTGRTLEENKYSIGFGADDIVIKSSDKSLSVSKNKPFVPSLAGSYGLPWRFEIGMRYYPANVFEASLRDQVNPRTFDVVDFSLNLHYSIIFGSYSYLRYGATLSKNIREFEPYVHYSAYQFVGATSAIFDNSFISGSEAIYVNNNRAIGFGIALPLKSAKLFPEVNYQYFGGDLTHGLWHFGIGVRVYPGTEGRSQ